MSEIFTFEEIYRAYTDCRKTKRKTINALKFEYNFENNLLGLLKDLKAKTYRPGKSICFVVTEPSIREIFAASFRDRVVHHLFVREVESFAEKNLIYDSFACRKGKGTHKAIARLRVLIGRATKNYRQKAYYLQLDISGFFMAINHDILFSFFEKLIARQNKSVGWKNDILWLAKVIIFHKPTENYITKGNPALFNLLPPRKSLFDSPAGKGLPIGNYSSQFFANIYLNELDQFVKRKLKCRNYIRYVDDFIILGHSKTELKEIENKINDFLKNNLDLKLNLDKTILQQVSCGIDFLGYFVKPDYVLVRRRVVVKLKSILHKYCLSTNKCDNINNVDLKSILATINSYCGHFKHAFTYNLRKCIYENYLCAMRGKFLPAKDYLYLKYAKK